MLKNTHKNSIIKEGNAFKEIYSANRPAVIGKLLFLMESLRVFNKNEQNRINPITPYSAHTSK
jgi:hypothetical protein